jgi:hypothetical protein
LRLTNYRHVWAHCLDNVGSLTSHNSTGLHGLLRGWLHFLLLHWLIADAIPHILSTSTLESARTNETPATLPVPQRALSSSDFLSVGVHRGRVFMSQMEGKVKNWEVLT